MYGKYSFENGVVKIRQIDTPDVEFNMLSDLQASFSKYITSTIKEDVQYLCELIRTGTGVSDLDVKVRVGDLRVLSYTETMVSSKRCYYPVYVTFLQQGVEVTPEWELLRIPYMDPMGKLNWDGKMKVCMSVQRSSEDISYANKTATLNIAMPHANIRIDHSGTQLKLVTGGTKVSLTDLIMAKMAQIGDDTKLSDIFCNTILMQKLKYNPHSNYNAMLAQLESATYSARTGFNVITKLDGDQYNLGSTRASLNENLGFERAIGQILAEDTCGIPANTMISADHVKTFLRNRIGVIRVRNTYVPTGYVYAERAPLFVHVVPAGTRNCALLRKHAPQYSDAIVMPENVVLNEPIVISNTDPLTAADIEFFICGGYPSIPIKPMGSQKVIMFSFMREIASNCTARLRDLTDDIPAGRSADEWVYYYNNPDLLPNNPAHLTAHDLIAIASVIGEIESTGTTYLLNRDTSFLKKVLKIDEIFSETLRRAMVDRYNKGKSFIRKSVLERDQSNPFSMLTKDWLSVLTQERYLATPDVINLSAEISQVCHVNTVAPTTSEIVDEQRHLAMPYYGRICPYETPAGKKLGVVNTQAVGCRVEDGMGRVPYLPIISTSDGVRIGQRITWLDQKEEIGKSFADALSFEYNTNGTIRDTYVLARIPNPDISDEPFIFKNVRVSTLVNVGFVPAIPEQYLSPTACLMPFASEDDPVRVSYGLSQMRQAIYLLRSEKPLVQTSMYKKMLDATCYTNFLSPCDGVVEEVAEEYVKINCTNPSSIYFGTTTTVLCVNNLSTGQVNTYVTMLVKKGDAVAEGQVIGRAHTFSQPFVVYSPIDGKVLEITSNMISLTKQLSGGFVDTSQVVNIPISNSRMYGTTTLFMNIRVSVGETVHAGQILADTCASREGVYSPARSPLVAYDCYGYNYEDAVVATEKATINYVSLSTHSIERRVHKRGTSYNRPSINHDFKYRAPFESVGRIITTGNTIDSGAVKSTQPVLATLKANGIPYEVQVTNDTPSERVYQFHVLSLNKLGPGDKMAGRHGNKGVISSLVLKDSEAPQLKNGLTVEFILGPCGIPSRMNLGQLDDMHMGLVAKVLGIVIESDAFNGASPEDVKYWMLFTWELANTPAIGTPGMKREQCNRAAFDSIFNKYDRIPGAIREIVWGNIENVIDWQGVFNKTGSAVLYDPWTDTYFDGEVAIGYPMYCKLVQEADEKLNVRSGPLSEHYTRTTSQPSKDYDSAKGQRLGEMEFVALASLGVSSYIEEALNEKSDNEGARTNMHLEQLGLQPELAPEDCQSRAVSNLLYMFEVCGVHVDVDQDIAMIDSTTSRKRKSINLLRKVNDEFSPKDASKPKESLRDIED